MAKRRKKTTKSTTRRRRRVNGVGKLDANNLLQTIGGVLLGVVGAGYINKLALSGKSNTIQAVVPLAAGVLVPMFMKNKLGEGIGNGMVAYGGTKFLQQFGLAGIGESFDVPVMISGDDQLSIMAGDDEFAMAGDDEFAMAGDDYLTSLAGTGMFDDED